MFRLNRAMVNVHRMYCNGRLMQQVSTRREQRLQHIPQAQQLRGHLSKQRKNGRGAVTNIQLPEASERPTASQYLNRIR
jgi:hypothetical protein